ncbi:hypothetical protein TD95_001878 [Thielaviopsis punctulata]|uniref:Nudix hydrolase domain-containing protein n=1 Tax=Thielaviopsis punctulata TaxID=72032 RepID=A0A0F4ZDG9_9PEZI|nr:hypothetical protein TD95_001878 [Thielaviopsis punctulata]
MAPLNLQSLAAVARLRRFSAPSFPLWNNLPACRRAGVLILLYPDRVGDLRVVLTMRATGMRNFGGHAAFPGGKADSKHESPYEIARREAWEEIGLPQTNAELPPGFEIQFLCYLPHALARTDVVVRPCVALLNRVPARSAFTSSSPSFTAPPFSTSPIAANALKPTPDANEVAAVFSSGLADFLTTQDTPTRDADSYRKAPTPPGPWYTGHWADYDGQPWRVHNFYVPITNQRVAKPPPSLLHPAHTQAGDPLEEYPGRYKVWGMTAKILTETARVAYARRPSMEHNEQLGDEDLAMRAADMGRFFDRQRRKKSLQRPSAMPITLPEAAMQMGAHFGSNARV